MDFDAIENMFFTQNEDEIFGEDWLQCYATEILDTKHQQTEITNVLDKLTHLNTNQKTDSLQVLQNNSKMFDVILDIYSS